jgi:hypothetical protein
MSTLGGETLGRAVGMIISHALPGIVERAVRVEVTT